MDVKKEAIGILAAILLVVPLAVGGFWVVKSLLDDPDVSKERTYVVHNHATQEHTLADKETSDLESFFEQDRGELVPEEGNMSEGVNETVGQEENDTAGGVDSGRNETWDEGINTGGAADREGNNNENPVQDSPAENQRVQTDVNQQAVPEKQPQNEQKVEENEVQDEDSGEIQEENEDVGEEPGDADEVEKEETDKDVHEEENDSTDTDDVNDKD